MASPCISRGALPNSCHHHQFLIENYLIKTSNINDSTTDIPAEFNQYFAFKEPFINIFQPRLCIFEFMAEDELSYFLSLIEEPEIKHTIELKLDKENPKGEPRNLFISMIFTVRKFCKKTEFSNEKSGAVLSAFYLTHIYTTNKFYVSADNVYSYFKELIFCHVLPHPPFKKRIFTQKEVKLVMDFFYKIYMRNLPLIRLLCLPNFAFRFHFYEKDVDQNIGDETVTDEMPEKRKKEKASKKTGEKPKKNGTSKDRSKTNAKKKK